MDGALTEPDVDADSDVTSWKVLRIPIGPVRQSPSNPMIRVVKRIAKNCEIAIGKKSLGIAISQLTQFDLGPFYNLEFCYEDWYPEKEEFSVNFRQVCDICGI